MENFGFCIDKSKRPFVITRIDSINAPSGLNRQEFATSSDSKEEILKAAKALHPDAEFVFEKDF